MRTEGVNINQVILSISMTLLFAADMAVRAESLREKEKKILDDILSPKKYDYRIRPSGVNGTDGPTVVKVNTYIRSIDRIDDVLMEYDTQLTLRQQWEDDRLKFDDNRGKLRYLTMADSRAVWIPDLFFTNEKQAHFHDVTLPNTYVRLFPDGGVLYSIRLSLTLSCPMNLGLYPLDSQTCFIKMSSYGRTTDDIVFLWKDGDPVSVTNSLHLPRFTLEKFITDYCNSKTATGEYSCLKVDMLFKRELSYYITQIYIPCCMLVIVSWFSFWLDQKAVTARVVLCALALLVMAGQVSNLNSSLPPVSYTKAIDVWTGTCVTFVFVALMVVVLTNFLSRTCMQIGDCLKKQPVDSGHPEGTAAANSATHDHPLYSDNTEDSAVSPITESLAMKQSRVSPGQLQCCKSCLGKFATWIDVFSRFAFPIAFVLFNWMYWDVYEARAERQRL